MIVRLIGIISVIMIMAGCAANSVKDVKIEGADEVTAPSLGIPYSKGPDSSPQVNGPSSPPPVQAVTESEDGSFSIPSSATDN